MHFFHPQEAQVSKKRHTKLRKTITPITATIFLTDLQQHWLWFPLLWKSHLTRNWIQLSTQGTFGKGTSGSHNFVFWSCQMKHFQRKKISQTCHKQRTKKKKHTHNLKRVYMLYFSCPPICPAPRKRRKGTKAAPLILDRGLYIKLHTSDKSWAIFYTERK